MKPPCLFVLYEDDSVEIQYSDGSQLQLSPCGSEFFFENPLPASAHPLQQPERIRQRTQFAISNYKDQVLQALEFRNRFSVCPYLPSSMIPSERIINFLTSISETKWPSKMDACVNCQDNGSVKVSSVDGHAHLYLSEHQQEFTIEFLCKVSQKSTSPTLKLGQSSKCTQSKSNTPCDGSNSKLEESSKELTTNDTEHELSWNTVGDINKKDSIYPVEGMALSPEPFTKHAMQYTWVVQQCSVSFCPEEWRYPLSLAINFYSLRNVNKTELTEDSRIMDSPILEDYGQERTISVLPKALPLICDAPHLHRWSYFDLISERKEDIEQYSRPGLINVVWCKGILYRFIHGSMSSVEIYPGDGSFFISQGASFGKYFTHCSVQEVSRKKEERMYAVTNLPPDKPECRYSVCAIITKATRTLEHCYKTELSLSYGCEICCWKMVSPADKTAAQPVILKQTVIENMGRFSAYSNNRVIADFFDGVTLHMIWNCMLYHTETQNLDNAILSETSQIHQDATAGWCQLFFPNGGHQLIRLDCSGPFESYVKAVLAWCRMLNVNSEREIPDSNVEENRRSVIAELQKIQRFNFLLENSNVPRNTSDLEVIQHCNTDKRTFIEDASLPDDVCQNSILAILEKTSKVIKDIDVLLSSSSKK